MVKVSVIVPSYNHEHFLQQRIDSILNQSFQDFELILLDDASTDKSKAIFNFYKDNSKVSHCLINTINSKSVFKQWIKGIGLAKGEYIWIAESDDYANLNFLEETVKVLENDFSLGMVFTNSYIIKGEVESELKCWSKELQQYNYIIDKNNASKFLLSEMIIPNASAVLFKKQALLNIDFKTLERFRNTGDRFTYIGIALSSKIKYVPKRLNFIRIHDFNITKKNMLKGSIFQDRIFLLKYYLYSFKDLKNTKKDVLKFLKQNYLKSVDFGYAIELRNLMVQLYKTNYVDFNLFLILYSYCVFNPKSFFFRRIIKKVLGKI